MKNFIYALLCAMFCFFFASCDKDEQSNEEKQEQENKNEESQNDEAAVSVEISDFKYTFNDADNTATVCGYNVIRANMSIPSKVTHNGKTYIVTRIQKGTFDKQCSDLKSIKIPSTVVTIDDYTLTDYQCEGLEEIIVDKRNENYSSDNGVLLNKEKSKVILCPKMKKGKYTIPNTVTVIGGRAFHSCENLTDIEIPNSVITIGHSAFCFCTGLTSINIPNSVTTINGSAFVCTSLTSIVIPNSVTKLGDRVFNGCEELTEVKLSNSITTIETDTFWGCKKLKSIEIPNSVTTIEYEAFHGCTSLTSITIPISVTTIEKHAFRNCTSIKSIEITNSVTTIENGAFINCTNLKTAKVPRGCEMSEYAFPSETEIIRY